MALVSRLMSFLLDFVMLYMFHHCVEDEYMSRGGNLKRGIDDTRIMLTWLTFRYDDNFWFWELSIMARKLYFVIIGSAVDSVPWVWAQYFGLTAVALILQIACRPLAGRDTKDDEANKMERNILLVETATVGLGGYFIFGDQSSKLAEALAIFVIVINFMTVLPALRVLHQILRRKLSCYAALTKCGKGSIAPAAGDTRTSEHGDLHMKLLGGHAAGDTSEHGDLEMERLSGHASLAHELPPPHIIIGGSE